LAGVETITRIVRVLTHPPFSAITVYTVVLLGFTMMNGLVVAGLVHVNVVLPLAVSVVELPAQIAVLPVIAITGAELVLTLIVPVAISVKELVKPAFTLGLYAAVTCAVCGPDDVNVTDGFF
jgi:hypothetical protein